MAPPGLNDQRLPRAAGTAQHLRQRPVSSRAWTPGLHRRVGGGSANTTEAGFIGVAANQSRPGWARHHSFSRSKIGTMSQHRSHLLRGTVANPREWTLKIVRVRRRYAVPGRAPKGTARTDHTRSALRAAAGHPLRQASDPSSSVASRRRSMRKRAERTCLYRPRARPG